MGRYDGAYNIKKLANIINSRDMGLNWDDWLFILRNCNGRTIDKIRKQIIKINNNIKSSQKMVNFLDITFNVNNGAFIN